MEKLFEKLTRNKARFGFNDIYSLENLWDLTPKKLDAIFKGLSAYVEKVPEKSLLDKTPKKNQIILDKIEIVSYIVKVKLNEAKESLDLINKTEKKEQIMSILTNKQEKELANKTVEELEKMLSSL